MKRLKTICLWAYLAIANHVVSKIPFNSIRGFIYRNCFCISMGRGSVIHMNCFVMKPRLIKIGNNTLINSRCTLDGRMGLTIGSNVDIAMETSILTLGHDINSPDYDVKGAEVTIGDRACIYTRSMILPGVHIGEGAVVAAGSVVTRDVDPYTIVAGSPAQKIGDRNRDLNYTLNVSRYFH